MGKIIINVPNKNLPILNNNESVDLFSQFQNNLANLSFQGEPINKYIEKVSKITNVPISIIQLFIFLSSKGDSSYVSKDNFTTEKRVPYGLMGISDTTAQNTLFKENFLSRLSDNEIKEIISLIGEKTFNEKILFGNATVFGSTNTNPYAKIKLDSLTNKATKNSFGNVNVNDYNFFNTNNSVEKMPLNNDKFNVLIGSILIGQFLDKYSNKIEQIIPIYLNIDNPKNIDYNWAINFKGSNIMDLYNKLSLKGKNQVNLAMSKGGFLNKIV